MPESKIETIRKKARRELCEWLATSVKEETLDRYKALRAIGFRASEALSLAKQTMVISLNQQMEANFYAGLPH